MRYRNRIDARKRQNPCLTGLSEYLSQQEPSQTCRCVALDFLDGTEPPVYCELTKADLNTRLQCDNEENVPKRRIGQLLIIEDISPELIEILGSRLDIDPWFFASYVYNPWRNPRYTAPQTCTLPSRERVQNFVSLAFHKSLSFIADKPQPGGFLRDSNQHRKVVVLPDTTGQCIGLAQQNCAVLLKDTKPTWTGIILVDPPISDRYKVSNRSGSGKRMSLPSRPFLGGPEDFTVSRNWSIAKPGKETPQGPGMLDELVHYWGVEPLLVLDPSQPTVQALSYLPLKIVAAEWINYISVMGFSLKHYESSAISNDLQAELDRLSANLRTLQTWRRRVLASMEKIHASIRYIKHHEQAGRGLEKWNGLCEDYEFISSGIQEHGMRLESMIPVVTTFIQLVESRRALLETANVTRLTVLAMVFIPLSYVASLFSMSERFGPGGPMFWMYFVIAIPITGFVLLVARAPKPKWPSPHWPVRWRVGGRRPSVAHDHHLG